MTMERRRSLGKCELWDALDKVLAKDSKMVKDIRVTDFKMTDTDYDRKGVYNYDGEELRITVIKMGTIKKVKK